MLACFDHGYQSVPSPHKALHPSSVTCVEAFRGMLTTWPVYPYRSISSWLSGTWAAAQVLKSVGIAVAVYCQLISGSAKDSVCMMLASGAYVEEGCGKLQEPREGPFCRDICCLAASTAGVVTQGCAIERGCEAATSTYQSIILFAGESSTGRHLFPIV